MASSGMLRRVDLVRTDISEELSVSFIRMTRIGELGTTLAVTSNRHTLRRNTKLFLLKYVLDLCQPILYKSDQFHLICNPVRTSQVTATDLSRLMLCKI
jgi:hypothetical protein